MPTADDSQREAWSRVAAGWLRQAERFATYSAPVTARMLELAQLRFGHRLLDVACGVGEPALTAAGVVGRAGRVAAYDLTPPMVEFARQRARQAGVTNVRFECAGAEDLELPPATFDALTMRWGLMFVAEPVRTLARLQKGLRPGAHAVLACWTAPERNPVIDLVQRTARETLHAPEPDPDEPHTFAYADGRKLRNVLEEAGFVDVHLEELSFTMLEVADAQEYWDVMSDLSATVNGLLQKAGDAARAAFVQTVLERAQAYRQDGRLRFPGLTWIARGTKPA